jgi:hypothetical protein
MLTLKVFYDLFLYQLVNATKKLCNKQLKSQQDTAISIDLTHEYVQQWKVG